MRADGASMSPAAASLAVPAAPSAWARFLDGDVWHSFRSSPMAMTAAAVALVCTFCALFAGVVAPHNPFDLATLELGDSMLPPSWLEGGRAKYLLGTDEQGRDVLSALMYGARISLLIGVSLGLLSGYAGGRVDAFIMRVCDVMLSFPSILIALLIAGVGHALFPHAHDSLAFGVLILAIALPGWVQYARTVRGSTMVERNKEYVQAARVVGVPPMLVLATIHLALAIQTEATLSFLGVGVSPTSPSLGTFINEGNKQLFSGAWWLVIFPGAMLLLIALSMNLFGDWLRDALNPRLR
jgi:peptide/nickel transport system permease protein